ncbi:MAG TPA: hypothetical protein VK254_00050 [Candidatus Bathyarchaeia archaeon]|nr:hypothetical protein [Candidatus Bathyarchaeia archaeon]
MISKKKIVIAKGKNIAKKGVSLSAFVFAFSFLASYIITNGSALNFLGNVSVFSILFLAFSAACLLLLQVESWDSDSI